MPLPTEKLAAQPAKTTTTTTQQRRHTTGTNPPRSVARRGVPPPTGGTARWARWARRATARRASPSGPKLRGQWAGGKNCPGSAGRGRGGMRRRRGDREGRGQGAGQGSQSSARQIHFRSGRPRINCAGAAIIVSDSDTTSIFWPSDSVSRLGFAASICWASRPRY